MVRLGFFGIQHWDPSISAGDFSGHHDLESISKLKTTDLTNLQWDIHQPKSLHLCEIGMPVDFHCSASFEQSICFLSCFSFFFSFHLKLRKWSWLRQCDCIKIHGLTRLENSQGFSHHHAKKLSRPMHFCASLCEPALSTTFVCWHTGFEGQETFSDA